MLVGLYANARAKMGWFLTELHAWSTLRFVKIKHCGSPDTKFRRCSNAQTAEALKRVVFEHACIAEMHSEFSLFRADASIDRL